MLARRSVIVATLVLLGGCLAGIVMAFINLSEDEAIGPLSEWIPGTVTAVALSYTLLSQRHADSVAAERERRAQAEKVYVWIERRYRGHTIGNDSCIVRWSNVSDGPAYRCRFVLIFPNGSEQPGAIGTIPPHQPIDEADTGYSITAGAAPEPSDRFPIGVRCEFEDAQGHTWRRDPSGKLDG
jgi:hypothetical protein